MYIYIFIYTYIIYIVRRDLARALKKFLGVLSNRCFDLAIYTDLFTLRGKLNHRYLLQSYKKELFNN